jgi:hypothetical protein
VGAGRAGGRAAAVESRLRPTRLLRAQCRRLHGVSDHSGGVRPFEVPGVKMEGVAVHLMLSKGGDTHLTTFVWWWADVGIGGALTTERPDIGGPFLQAFLAAQPS